MIYKQDFTNVIDQQIDHLQKEIDLINKEISVRKLIDIKNESSESKWGDFLSLEAITNKKEIINLERSLLSKNDWLAKLKDDKLNDDSEREEDYQLFLNEYDDLKLKCNEEMDVHDSSRVMYILLELQLYFEEKNKEACVFYYRSLKMCLEEAGINVIKL